MADGLLGGVSNFLYGSAPGAGFDPMVYLARMREIENQISSLYASAPKSDVINSPAFSRISGYLSPNANGSLSTPLAAMYASGSQMNALNAGANQASALTQVKNRGLSGSSIEAQVLENQGMNASLANSSLLASLYGLQNNNTSQLSGLLGQGQEFDVSQNNSMLNSRADALARIASGYGGVASQGMQMNQASNMAQYQNNGNLTNGLLSALTMYSMMPGGGSTPGGGGGFATSPSMTLPGSGYGMPGFGGSSYVPGLMAYGPGGYGR